MIDKIPTAEKILSSYSKNYSASENNPRAVVKASEALEAMIEFAKLHVEAALKEASEKADLIEPDGDIDVDSIIESYPLTNIK